MQYKEHCLEFRPWNMRARTRFHCQGYPFTKTHLLQHVKVVDVTFKTDSIYVISQATPSFIPSPATPSATTLQDMYRDLSPELQRIVGTIQWPSPQELIDIVNFIRQGTAIGVSDGSVRVSEIRASHAWILQAWNGSAISGKGPIDGSLESRTSHRAELHGDRRRCFSFYR